MCDTAFDNSLVSITIPTRNEAEEIADTLAIWLESHFLYGERTIAHYAGSAS
jgi:hypothetical protein